MSKPKTRKEAKDFGASRYFTGEPCCYGHISERLTRTAACQECERLRKIEYRVANIDKEREAGRRRAYKAREHKRRYHREWYLKNREAVLIRTSKYRQDNKQHLAEQRKRRRSDNPWVTRIDNANRKARRLLCTPIWCDRAEVRKIYKEARLRQEQTGIPHEVDHVYPLKGKTVCGLHVPENLRITTRTENRKKWVFMPDEFSRRGLEKCTTSTEKR